MEAGAEERQHGMGGEWGKEDEMGGVMDEKMGGKGQEEREGEGR